jgi:hypothetical protein
MTPNPLPRIDASLPCWCGMPCAVPLRSILALDLAGLAVLRPTLFALHPSLFGPQLRDRMRQLAWQELATAPHPTSSVHVSRA